MVLAEHLISEQSTKAMRKPYEYPALVEPLNPAQVLNLTQGQMRSRQPKCCDLWLLSAGVDLLEREILERVLSPADKRHADCFRFEKDRLRAIVTRGSLRRILSSYCGIPPHALEFRSGSYGKPMLVNSSWPVEFNVSHSGDCVLIGVTAGTPCGVDIEHNCALDLNQETIEKMLCPREIEWLRRNVNGFQRLWTAKEAIMKAIGLGLSIPLHAIDVRDIVEGKSSFSTSRIWSGKPQTLSVRELFLIPDYAIAVATADELTLRIVADSHGACSMT